MGGGDVDLVEMRMFHTFASFSLQMNQIKTFALLSLQMNQTKTSASFFLTTTMWFFVTFFMTSLAFVRTYHDPSAFPQSKPTQRLALLDTRLASVIVPNKQET